jgi:hypothetical protein
MPTRLPAEVQASSVAAASRLTWREKDIVHSHFRAVLDKNSQLNVARTQSVLENYSKQT